MSSENRIGASSGSSSFGAAALGGPQRGVLPLSSCVFRPVDPGAQNPPSLGGRVELGGKDLGPGGVKDINVPLKVTIPREILIGDGPGYLAGHARWNFDKPGDVQFDVDQLLQSFESKEGQDIARPLLVAILEAIRDEQDPQFDWDKDPNKKLDQIHGVFALCDYLSLQGFQEKHLEPFYEKFPGIAISDTPDTVFSLHRSEAELSPVLTDFRALKCLIIQGPVSQNFLDSLPPTLLRLDLLSCDMTNRILMRKEVALAAVAQSGGALVYASAALKADKEVVMAAVAQRGRALGYASVGLRADKEVVMAAVALVYASDGLRGDKEVVMAAVAQSGWALFAASDGLRGDKEVVMAAVAQDGWALFAASDGLRGDKEVVLAAVAQNGRALRFASDGLRGDRDVVMAAVAQDGRALQYASAGLRVDPDVVIVARAARVHPFTG